MVIVSGVSEKITRKSPMRKLSVSTPVSRLMLLACEAGFFAYSVIFDRISLTRFAWVRRARAAVTVEDRFYMRKYRILRL
jgi:hypothetical protein